MLDGNSVDLDGGCVAIRHGGGWLLAKSLPEAVSLTLLAVASDDPDSWEEVLRLWPRHRSPVVPPFLSTVTLKPADGDEVFEVITSDPLFVLIDLCQKRIATGTDYAKTNGDGRFVLDFDDSGKGRYPVGIHVPPWWEVVENVDADAAFATRNTVAERPSIDREFLFGDTMLRTFAEALIDSFDELNIGGRYSSIGSIATIESGEFPSEVPYDLLIQIHRDWLMTPHEEIGGQIPRQLLHGSHDWIESATTTQRVRFHDGLPIVAVPDKLASVTGGPMGLGEMVVYFNLCREVIRAGWFFLYSSVYTPFGRVKLSHERDEPLVDFESVAAFMRDFLDDWLNRPYEGGSPPRFVIECDRRRVPRGVNIPIEGMLEREREDRGDDCDCPHCEMMAAGHFAPSFACVTGYHLELDDDFAFSTCQTLDDWKLMQDNFDEFAENDLWIDDPEKGVTDPSSIPY